ncbi:hypothetical protein CRG98_041563 [Punica granatum]|uniref:Reverse transcriptase zinc-binding domain-containing protein n=1 Tax=Punica granatum TaxID=22663 RepID=A0A2I0I2I6_PUNGR|nr:hypothetical protein CRG98_041563 [Punica granatum]
MDSVEYCGCSIGVGMKLHTIKISDWRGRSYGGTFSSLSSWHCKRVMVPDPSDSRSKHANMVCWKKGVEILKKGLMWQIGDGRSVFVWSDLWVPGIKGFKLQAIQLATISMNFKPKHLEELWNLDVPSKIRIFIWRRTRSQLSMQLYSGVKDTGFSNPRTVPWHVCAIHADMRLDHELGENPG